MADTSWIRILEHLASRVKYGDFKVWIAPICAEIKGTTISLFVNGASEYMADRLKKKMEKPILSAASEVLGVQANELSLHVSNGAPSSDAIGIPNNFLERFFPEARPASAKARTPLVPSLLEAVGYVRSTAPNAQAQKTKAAPSSPTLLPSAETNKPTSEALPSTTTSALPIASVPLAAVQDPHTTHRIIQGSLMGYIPIHQPVSFTGHVLHSKLGRFSFEDFVVGPSNVMAAAAAEDLCRDHSSVETLFLSAQAGLGKTHIVQSVAKKILFERGDAARVAYLTADDFYSRYRIGLKNNNLEEFTDEIKALDFLMFDDVQLLNGKVKTQELLLSLIKYLQNKGSRVVFTSKFVPHELTLLDSQLVSLFGSGILANMEMPTYDMRREILTRKAKIHQVILPNEVTDLLATNLVGDIRQLESCLQTLLLKMRILNTNLITPEMAFDVLHQFMPEEKTETSVRVVANFDQLMSFVAEGYGITTQQICSKIRRKDFVNARNILYYLARKHTGMTLSEIGAQVGKRHSTVIKGISLVENELDRNSSIGREYSRVIGLIEKNVSNREHA